MKITFKEVRQLIKTAFYIKIDSVVCEKKEAVNICHKNLGNLFYENDTITIENSEKAIKIELIYCNNKN